MEVGEEAESDEEVSVVHASNSSEFQAVWKPYDWNDSGEQNYRNLYVRSQSLSAFQLSKYSATDLHLMRERLIRAGRLGDEPSAHGKPFTRTQKLTLASLALVDFITFCSMSIMAPFFPKEAHKKGMSQAVSGLVFSAYAVVVFLSAPVFGKILPRIGAKFLFLAGVSIAGSCNLLFGVLTAIEDLNTFTAYCLIVRSLEALGSSAYSTASYVYVVDVFPEHIGSVLGILETFVGLGMAAGPALGGLLYAYGGYPLPFACLGILMLCVVPVTACLMPAGDAPSLRPKQGSLLQLLAKPSVLMASCVIVVASNAWGFLDPTLEPHLRQFDISPTETGLIFLLFSAIYGISSPLWGWLADRAAPWPLMTTGLALTSLGLMLLGPSPLLPFLKPSLPLVLGALSIFGASVALAILPTFQALLTCALQDTQSDHVATYSLVAGLWSCMYSLGEVIGPSVGGSMLQAYGFPITSTTMALLTLGLSILCAIYYLLRRDAAPSRPVIPETDPLISTTPPPTSREYRDKHHYVHITGSGACEV